MISTFSGIVIRSVNSGEADKLITVLSGEQGKVTLLVKGARKPKSKFLSSAGLFSYAEFTVGKTGNYTYLREADLKENFYELRRDVASVSLAGYMCSVCDDVATEDDSPLMLRLLLNALYVLNNGSKDMRLVKAVFEMRMACICGFTPDGSACACCDGRIGTQDVYLDVMNGAFICQRCKSEMNDGETTRDGEAYIVCHVTAGALAAVRYIIDAEPKRIFSFSLQKADMDCLEQVCEKYLLHHLERSFETLDFYKTVREG